jgi:anti-sigma regulatory factor (Ser/Thr protein kinase)
MGRLRNACRVCTAEGHEPAGVVERLNRLVGDLPDAEMATICYVTLDPISGQARWVSGGHPPPAIRTPDGKVDYVGDATGIPLGVADDVEYTEVPFVLDPDATLVLYTDGLVEERTVPLDCGLIRLAQAVSDGPPDPGLLASHVLQRVFGGAQPTDDVALLVLRRGASPAGRLAVQLPADAAALGTLRQELRRWLLTAGADDDEAYDLTLAIAEAAASVAEHAEPHRAAVYDLSGTCVEGVVQIALRGFGRWRPPPGTDRGRGLLVMQALVDELSVVHGDDGTEVRVRHRLRA